MEVVWFFITLLAEHTLKQSYGICEGWLQGVKRVCAKLSLKTLQTSWQEVHGCMKLHAHGALRNISECAVLNGRWTVDVAVHRTARAVHCGLPSEGPSAFLLRRYFGKLQIVA